MFFMSKDVVQRMLKTLKVFHHTQFSLSLAQMKACEREKEKERKRKFSHGRTTPRNFERDYGG
jgi:hypothetical protein